MRWMLAAAAASLAIVTAGPGAAEEAVPRDLTPAQVEAYKAGVPRQSSLQVIAKVDRADLTYTVGDVVKLTVQVNEDAHVAVFNIGPKGRITQLFPNRLQKESLIKAGQEISVPPKDSATVIKVTGDTGAELIKVVASNRPLKIVSDIATSEGQAFLPIATESGKFSRDLGLATSDPGPAEKWSLVNIAIRTVPAKKE